MSARQHVSIAFLLSPFSFPRADSTEWDGADCSSALESIQGRAGRGRGRNRVHSFKRTLLQPHTHLPLYYVCAAIHREDNGEEGQAMCSERAFVVNRLAGGGRDRRKVRLGVKRYSGVRTL